MASFLGIGIGILLGRRRQLDTIAIFPVLLPVRRRADHQPRAERPGPLDRRAVLRPRREPGRGRELPRPADRVRARHRADGHAGDPARSPAPLDAAAGGVRLGHRRLDARHRRVHDRCRPPAPRRSCGSRWRRSSSSSWSAAGGSRSCSASRPRRRWRSSSCSLPAPRPAARSGRRTTGSTPTSPRTASCTSTSTASPTRRSTRSMPPRSSSTTSSTSGSRIGRTTRS